MLLGQKSKKVFRLASSEPGTHELRERTHRRLKGEGAKKKPGHGRAASTVTLQVLLPSTSPFGLRSVPGPLRRGTGSGSSSGTDPPSHTRPPDLPDRGAPAPSRPPPPQPWAGPWQRAACAGYGPPGPGRQRRGPAERRAERRRGGEGKEPAPAGAAPRPAAPMGGRAGRGAAAAAHVAFPRWRPGRTELRGRLPGRGRRVAAEGGGRGPAALASPRLPAG